MSGPALGFPPPRGMRADRGRSLPVIERAAMRLRRILAPGVALDHALPGVEVFEGLEGFGVVAGGRRYTLDPAVNDLPRGIEALAMYDPGANRITLALSPATYAGLENDDGRDRFTAFHEVGHAALHCAELVRLSRIPHVQGALMRGANNHAHYEDTEWQADAFSSALLMPAKGLELLERRHGFLTPRLLQNVFAVSSQAAEIRLSVFARRRGDLLAA